MDYSSMKAQKKSKKSPEIDFNLSKKEQKSIEKSIKRSGVSIILVIVLLLVGALGGWLVCKFAFSSDTYAMVAYGSGKSDIVIGPDGDDEHYTELGVKCIAFGKDISSECTVTYYYRADLTQDEVKVDGVDETVPGMYYAKYQCNNIKYKSVTLIRNIVVLEVEDNG